MCKTYRALALRWIGIRVRSLSAISHRSLLLRIWTVRAVLLRRAIVRHTERLETRTCSLPVSMLANTNAISDTLKSDMINHHTSIVIIVIVIRDYLPSKQINRPLSRDRK
jgi:hypothetical protein